MGTLESGGFRPSSCSLGSELPVLLGCLVPIIRVFSEARQKLVGVINLVLL